MYMYMYVHIVHVHVPCVLQVLCQSSELDLSQLITINYYIFKKVGLAFL